jgi:hypothetical protein
MSIADTTKRQYDYYIAQLKERTGISNLMSSKAMITAIKGLKKSDGTALGDTTRRNYYIALAYHTKTNPEANLAYRKAYQDLNKSIKKNEKKTIPSPAIGYTDLQEIGKMIVQEDEETLENRILAGLITQMPPVRLDYARLKVFPKVQAGYKDNYIVLGSSPKTSQFIAQRHKTAKTYGALRRTLTPEVYAVVKEWNDMHPGAILLDMTDNSLGKRIPTLMKKYVGDAITMNDIRHSYITAARKGDKSKAEVESIAHMMGHSLAMNYDYRRE